MQIQTCSAVIPLDSAATEAVYARRFIMPREGSIACLITDAIELGEGNGDDWAEWSDESDFPFTRWLAFDAERRAAEMEALTMSVAERAKAYATPQSRNRDILTMAETVEGLKCSGRRAMMAVPGPRR